MKVWVDDMRPAPEGFKHVHSVNEFIWLIENTPIALGVYPGWCEMHLDLDHDAGDYFRFGGDYIRVLDYLAAHDYGDMPIKISLHTMNPVGRRNMESLISRFPAWMLVKE